MNGNIAYSTRPSFIYELKDPGSAITHGVGLILAAVTGVPLMIRAMISDGGFGIHTFAEGVFVLGMILLYGASTAFHSFDVNPRVNMILKKLDHCMIAVLIAASYTPVCLLGMGGRSGAVLLSVIWGLAVLAVLFKLVWVTCPRWTSSVIYLFMGWACVAAFPELIRNMSGAEFGFLLAGGVIYSAGAVIYALKLPLFNSRHRYFGSHEIFHLFVMGGTACHCVTMMLLA